MPLQCLQTLKTNNYLAPTSQSFQGISCKFIFCSTVIVQSYNSHLEVTCFRESQYMRRRGTLLMSQSKHLTSLTLHYKRRGDRKNQTENDNLVSNHSNRPRVRLQRRYTTLKIIITLHVSCSKTRSIR